MSMLRVVFNIEAGNYYSKSTFMTPIKQEKLVFTLVILYVHLGVFICVFTKLITGI